jgi:DNA polymerase, archaea type
MKSNNPRTVRGWLFDIYPTVFGEMTVWIISENGERIRLTDRFQPKVYVTGTKEDLERLIGKLYSNKDIAHWDFIFKYANPTDSEKSKVLEVTLMDCRRVNAFTNDVLKLGDFLRYEVHNCDLHGDRAYLFEKGLFPLAFLEVQQDNQFLKYNLLDKVESIDYTIPTFRVMRLTLEVAKHGKLASLEDPIGSFQLEQDSQTIIIEKGTETDKLLELAKMVKELDPDIILTNGGDSYLFSYLIQRAKLNNVLDQFVLSRDNTPFLPKQTAGKSFFSYGRVFYKAPTMRLFGRIHIDGTNTFILKESSFQGMFEIARTCRVPLHTASRSSIGSSMSSLQFYQAFKDDILLPRNKSIPENFKTAYELLVADRGGFVYEPRVGIHDDVGEVDFSSMYPSLMVNNNISAETVLCECCPDSKLRIPELNYNICEKREGVVPKSLRLILNKRLTYKRMKEETKDPLLKEIYDNRQVALKWILVTCFGYLGYRNSKFGTVDGHIGVCAFGRDALLKSSRTAESQGFEVIHGIVDSLWLKKKSATIDEYKAICKKISDDVGVSLNFEGKYKWIVFLPSRMHPNIGVLNRYYGVMESGKLKVRGLEVRKRDTPKFIFDAQTEMIDVLAKAGNATEFMEKIPGVLDVVKRYRQRLLDGDVSVWDLMVTKHLSKNPKHYKQHVSQVIASEQLIKEGADIHAGNSVSFLFTSAENKRYHRRVLAKQLVEEGVNADKTKYLFLLYNSASNLLSFKGYTAKTISDAVNGLSSNSLMGYL